MAQIGFSNSGIMLAMALMIACTLLFEVPSGVIADRWSRKGVLMLSQIALAGSSLAGYLSDNPAVYLISAGLWGVYYAMNSGVAESIIYDTLLEEQGNRRGFEKYFGRNKIAISVSLVIGSMVGGFAASAVDTRFAFLVSIPAVLFGLIALAMFKEPTLHKGGQIVTMKQHLKDSARMFKSSEVIVLICIVTVLFNSVYRFMFEFYQIWLTVLNMNIIYFGIILAILNTTFALAGLVAHRLEARNIGIVTIGLVATVSSLGLAVHSLYFVVPAAFVVILLMSVCSIILTGKLHDMLSSSQRSGISSAISSIGTVVFIGISLLASLVADISIYLTVPILFALLAVATFYSVKTQRHANYLTSQSTL